MTQEHTPHSPSARRGATRDGDRPAWTHLPVLPYAFDALEPYVSERTINSHYHQHHEIYIDNLRKMVQGTAYEEMPLPAIIQTTSVRPDKAAIFNNAAQVWNHSFFWNSMRPYGGGLPPPRLLTFITDSFGSFETFKNVFMTEALSQFGNGNVWLVQDASLLRVVKTSNADTPVAWGQDALISCDVWEHAYYLDYQNHRKDYVRNFLDHIVNWDFAAARLQDPVNIDPLPAEATRTTQRSYEDNRKS